MKILNLFKKRKINVQNKNGENDNIMIAIVTVISVIVCFSYFYTCLNKEENRVYNNYENVMNYIEENFSGLLSGLNENTDTSSIFNVLNSL